jgi:hypothetical protein
MTAADSALRMALCAMLADITYREIWKDRPWVDARLDEVSWNETAREGLKALAIRWAQHCHPRQALALRKAIGEVLTEAEQAILESPARLPSMHARMTPLESVVPPALAERTGALSLSLAERTLMQQDAPSNEVYGLDAYQLQELHTQREYLDRPPFNTPMKKLVAAFKCVLEGRLEQWNDTMWHVTGSKGDVYDVTVDGCNCPHGQHTTKTKYGCYHAVAVELYKRWQRAMQPSMFPPPRTADERLAAMPQKTAGVAPGDTQAPEDDIGDPPVPEGLLAPRGTENKDIMPNETKQEVSVPEPERVIHEIAMAKSHIIHSGAAMHEAPYSFNILVENADGFQAQFTIRAQEEAEFWGRIGGLFKRFKTHQMTPVKKTMARPAAPQAEAPPPAPTPEIPMCPYHGAAKPSEKAPGTYYCTKKMADGTYCQFRWPKSA